MSSISASNENLETQQEVVVDDHGHDDHGGHHEESFITKYIFSQDHKMISKQILGFLLNLKNFKASLF